MPFAFGKVMTRAESQSARRRRLTPGIFLMSHLTDSSLASTGTPWTTRVVRARAGSGSTAAAGASAKSARSAIETREVRAQAIARVITFQSAVCAQACAPRAAARGGVRQALQL